LPIFNQKNPRNESFEVVLWVPHLPLLLNNHPRLFLSFLDWSLVSKVVLEFLGR
jgi:hypothetical protein